MVDKQEFTYEQYKLIRRQRDKGKSIKALALENTLSVELIKKIVTQDYPYSKSQNLLSIQSNARNQEIVNLRRQGKTLEEIGESFGLTRERVRQIIVKCAKGEVFPTRLEVRQDKDLKEKRAIRLEITANWHLYKNMTMKKLADEYKMSAQALGQVINKVQYAYLRGNQKTHISQVWTHEMCIQVLREAATYAFPLTVLEYRRLVNSGTLVGPTLPIFISRFGSWMEACAKAGVETGNPVREYDTTWSDSDMLLMVRRFMWETRDAGWSVENYEKWRRSQDPAVASSALLRLRLGQWSEMRVLALDFEAPEYDMSIYEDLDNNDF